MTFARIVPLAALIWCAVLAPIQSEIWNADKTPLWLAGLTPLHAAASALYDAFAGTLPRYDFFGRLFTVVYAGIFVGVAAASPTPGVSSFARWIVYASLVAAFVGDVTAYWFAGIGNAPLRALGFWKAEVPALGVAVLAIAAIGVSMMRSRVTAGGAVVAATPLVALGATAAIQYMPHGPVLALALAATILAWHR